MAITDELLDQVRRVESADGRFLRSPAGALGPYQFMPATARQYGITDPMDERQSREGARRYLTDLYNQFGSIEAALTAYNWGPENLRAYQQTGKGARGQTMPVETQQYVPKVLGAKVAAGRDLSAELMGEPQQRGAGRDLSAELLDNKPKQSKPGAMLPASQVPPEAQPERTRGESYGRAAMLSLRAPLDAAANLVAIPGNAITSAYNLVTGRNVPSAGETYRGWIDSAFPKPETGVERFSNAVASTGYGVAVPAAIAGASRPASAVGQGVREALTQNIGSQIAGGTTGSGTTELLTQGGVDPTLSAAIGLAAGAAGGRAYQAGEDAATRIGASRSVAGGRTPQAVAGYDAKPMPTAARVQERMQDIASKAGVDLTTLPASVRAEFEKAVQSSVTRNAPMDPQQVQRWLTLQAAGIKNPTRAMVTRNAQDWAEEDRLMRLSGIGDPLRQRYDAAGDAIRGSIQPSTQPGDATTGQVVRGALREVADDLNTQRRAAYNAAWNAPEAKEGVPIAPLRQFLESKRAFFTTNPEYEATLGELNRLAGDRPALTQANYEQLRKSVNALYKLDNAGTLRDIKGALDDALTSAGKTTPFRDAREANQIYRSTVTDQGIVDRLLARRTLTDPKVWDNQVYDVVMSSAPDQIKQLRNTLEVGNRGGAWKTLQDRVKEDLTYTLNRSATTDDRAASFVQYFERNKERLAAIFGKDDFAQLKNARDAAELVMQKVRGAPTNPSGTAGNLVEYLRKAGVTLGPLARAANIGTAGLLGAAMDAGRQSMQNRADFARVSAAMNPGLLGAAPAAAAPTPILTPGLLGAIYGAQQSAFEDR